MKHTAPLRRASARTLLATGLITGLALMTGCTKSEDDSGNDKTASQQQDSGQVVASPSGGSGPTCTVDAYGGRKLDLKSATVGFSQSEKEANPFRIAETASIKAEAQKRGVKLLTATPSRSSPSRSATYRT